mmetsp:Transcript_32246/g.75985  ORF Transcript_32246/g.75985 Transcript_32246/m.75985 type:complete len:208 (+) Transcript_32246:1101-1724(+)
MAGGSRWISGREKLPASFQPGRASPRLEQAPLRLVRVASPPGQLWAEPWSEEARTPPREGFHSAVPCSEEARTQPREGFHSSGRMRAPPASPAQQQAPAWKSRCVGRAWSHAKQCTRSQWTDIEKREGPEERAGERRALRYPRPRAGPRSHRDPSRRLTRKLKMLHASPLPLRVPASSRWSVEPLLGSQDQDCWRTCLIRRSEVWPL